MRRLWEWANRPVFAPLDLFLLILASAVFEALVW